jgi:hypothetical protein
VISPVVMIGPYRTIVNKPASITLPFDTNKAGNAESVLPVIFNEVTQDWDPVFSVAGGAAMLVDPI